MILVQLFSELGFKVSSPVERIKKGRFFFECVLCLVYTTAEPQGYEHQVPQVRRTVYDDIVVWVHTPVVDYQLQVQDVYVSVKVQVAR